MSVAATVLVVDDSQTILKVLSKILGAEYEVLVATSGREALKIAATHNPDLILLDVEMPGLDGFEVCVALKASPKTAGIPVVFVTGLDTEVDEARGLDLGAIDFVRKPISPVILRARVRNQIELKRMRDELASMARRDGLTGIANRRCLDETLPQEWRRCERSGEPISLVMVDIDHFKRFNDRFGHVSGDVCIQRIAQAMEKAVSRPGDLIARYGGEEFALLLPRTDLDGAKSIAKRIHGAIAALAISDVERDSTVTVSLGVATVIPGHDQLPDTLIAAADALLYEAKRQGRDRAVGGGSAAEVLWVVLGSRGGDSSETS